MANVETQNAFLFLVCYMCALTKGMDGMIEMVAVSLAMDIALKKKKKKKRKPASRFLSALIVLSESSKPLFLKCMLSVAY